MNINTNINKLAETLLTLYDDQKSVVLLKKKLSEILSIFENESDLLTFYTDHSIESSNKKEFSDVWIKKLGFDQYFKNVVHILIDYKLSHSINDFFNILILEINKKLQVKNIYITSTIPFNSHQKQKFEVLFQKKFMCKLIFNYSVDPTMILGVKVKYDDTIEEISLTSQLSKITKQLGKHLIR